MEVTTLVAPNPGPYTGAGTNTYVLESGGEALIIDPGPLIPSHLDRIRRLVARVSLAGVVVTHHHPDHAPAAAPLASDHGVPSYGFGGGDFTPSIRVTTGSVVEFGAARLVVQHTPGHTPDSISLLSGRRLFAGDTVKGGSTVVVEDMAAYMSTLQSLIALEVDEIYPGHGQAQPSSVLIDYLHHRRLRENQVAAAVRHGNATLGDLVSAVYGDLDPSIQPLAARSLQAHVDKLVAEGRMTADLHWMGD